MTSWETIELDCQNAIEADRQVLVVIRQPWKKALELFPSGLAIGKVSKRETLMSFDPHEMRRRVSLFVKMARYVGDA